MKNTIHFVVHLDFAYVVEQQCLAVVVIGCRLQSFVRYLRASEQAAAAVLEMLAAWVGYMAAVREFVVVAEQLEAV